MRMNQDVLGDAEVMIRFRLEHLCLLPQQIIPLTQ